MWRFFSFRKEAVRVQPWLMRIKNPVMSDWEL